MVIDNSQGKKKIHEGESTNLVLEKEIEELTYKLVELQISSRMKNPEAYSCSNFDKQASLLQKKLEKYNEVQDDCCVKEIPEVSTVSLPVNCVRDAKILCQSSSRRSSRFTDVSPIYTYVCSPRIFYMLCSVLCELVLLVKLSSIGENLMKNRGLHL